MILVILFLAEYLMTCTGFLFHHCCCVKKTRFNTSIEEIFHYHEFKGCAVAQEQQHKQDGVYITKARCCHHITYTMGYMKYNVKDRLDLAFYKDFTTIEFQRLVPLPYQKELRNYRSYDPKFESPPDILGKTCILII